MKKTRLTYALLFLSVLLAEVLIALFVRDAFVRPYVGDMLVTLLICCFARIFFPTGVKLLPVYVFIFASAVEVGQYFDIVKLLGLENNTFLSVMLGRTFSLADIFCYAIGCLAFFGTELCIRRSLKNT
ncbi:MAG: DUF2809 domain-containing protein [Clostridia bacterium]|nr:DUF2809 domain-containing protein [Clostridia bacterium]